MSELRVDFYIIADASGSARLSLACRLAEKAYLASQDVLIWHTEPTELKALDDLLWTFRDGSFIPHEMLGGEAATGEAPVLLSAGAVPAGAVDVIINLAPAVPESWPSPGASSRSLTGTRAVAGPGVPGGRPIASAGCSRHRITYNRLPSHCYFSDG